MVAKINIIFNINKIFIKKINSKLKIIWENILKYSKLTLIISNLWGGGVPLPNVSYVRETNECNYTPKIIISFTIEGNTYQAEEGMTWGEWVNSKYNIGSVFQPYISGGLEWVYSSDGFVAHTTSSSEKVVLTEIITQSEYELTFRMGGGSN